MTREDMSPERRAALIKALRKAMGSPAPKREYVPPPTVRCPYCRTQTGNLWMIHGTSYFKCSICKRKLT